MAAHDILTFLNTPTYLSAALPSSHELNPSLDDEALGHIERFERLFSKRGRNSSLLPSTLLSSIPVALCKGEGAA